LDRHIQESAEPTRFPHAARQLGADQLGARNQIDAGLHGLLLPADHSSAMENMQDAGIIWASSGHHLGITAS
jgi:hypothetical protein